MAILALNGEEFENRVLKVSFGMTKYCQYFISNQECTNPECLYLHNLVEEDYQGFGDITMCDSGIPREDSELIALLLGDNVDLERFEESAKSYGQKSQLPGVQVALNKIKRYLRDNKIARLERRQSSFKKVKPDTKTATQEQKLTQSDSLSDSINLSNDSNTILLQQKINLILTSKESSLSQIEKFILRNLL